jgi:hypothetical protein
VAAVEFASSQVGSDGCAVLFSDRNSPADRAVFLIEFSILTMVGDRIVSCLSTAKVFELTVVTADENLLTSRVSLLANR